MQVTIEEIRAAYTRIDAENTNMIPSSLAWFRAEEEKEANQTIAALNIDPRLLTEAEADLSLWIEAKQRHLSAIVMVVNTSSADKLTCFGGDALLLYRLYRHRLWMQCRRSTNAKVPRLAEITINETIALELAADLKQYNIEMHLIERE